MLFRNLMTFDENEHNGTFGDRFSVGTMDSKSKYQYSSLVKEQDSLLRSNKYVTIYTNDINRDPVTDENDNFARKIDSADTNNNSNNVGRDNKFERSFDSETGATRFCRKRSWVEIPVFIYFFAYRAGLTLKEQFVFAAVSGMLLPPDGDYVADLAMTSSACSGNTTSIGSWNATQIDAEFEALQDEIQVRSSEWLSYMNLARNIPGLVMTLLICSLTDVKGRRIGLIIPCIGGALKSILFVIMIIFELPLWILLIAEGIEGFSGSIMTTQSVAYAYIVDTVDKEDKTFRFSVIHALYYVGTAVGNIFTGIIIRDCGFLFSFVIFACLYAFGIIIIGTAIYESNQKSVSRKPPSLKSTLYQAVTSFGIFVPRSSQKSDSKSNLTKGAAPVVGMKTLVILWILVIAFFTDSFVLQGRNDVDVLFMIAEPFCWSSLMVGYFQCAKYMAKALAATFIIRLLHQCVSDPMIGVAASVSGVVANAVMGYAHTGIILWMVTWLCMLSGLITPVASSIMSRLLPVQEQSALFASLGVLEGLGDLASGSVLDLIYSLTVSTYAGTVFVVISAVYAVAGLCFIVEICLEC